MKTRSLESYWTVEEAMLFHHLFQLRAELEAQQDLFNSMSATSEELMKALDTALQAITTERNRLLAIATARQSGKGGNQDDEEI